MEFYYPNRTNDMWRIWGLLALGDKNAFMQPDGKTFDKEKIETFCREFGLALTDTGEEVIRERGNASDAHLKIVKPRDFRPLMAQLPLCRDIVLTGEKAVATLGAQAGFDSIKTGEYIESDYFAGRTVRIWRMPSSSRAYPRSLEWKADSYRRVIEVISEKSR